MARLKQGLKWLACLWVMLSTIIAICKATIFYMGVFDISDNWPIYVAGGAGSYVAFLIAGSTARGFGLSE